MGEVFVDSQVEMYYTASTIVNGELYTYAESDILTPRRMWMTKEDMSKYKATPVTYPLLRMVYDQMLNMYGLDENSLIIREVN